MKLCIISDTHNRWKDVKVSPCDVLISCGDYSSYGGLSAVRGFHSWMADQPARYRVSVQGNREVDVERNFSLYKSEAESTCPGLFFIDEGAFEIEGVKFYGSAITRFFNNLAWNRRVNEIKRHWDNIPEDVEVLITHGPPYGMLDQIYYPDGVTVKEHVGCGHLWSRALSLKKLKLHCFGHIHGSSGEMNFNGVHFINASICDEMGMPTNPVREFEL